MPVFTATTPGPCACCRKPTLMAYQRAWSENGGNPYMIGYEQFLYTSGVKNWYRRMTGEGGLLVHYWADPCVTLCIASQSVRATGVNEYAGLDLTETRNARWRIGAQGYPFLCGTNPTECASPAVDDWTRWSDLTNVGFVVGPESQTVYSAISNGQGCQANGATIRDFCYGADTTHSHITHGQPDGVTGNLRLILSILDTEQEAIQRRLTQYGWNPNFSGISTPTDSGDVTIAPSWVCAWSNTRTDQRGFYALAGQFRLNLTAGNPLQQVMVSVLFQFSSDGSTWQDWFTGQYTVALDNAGEGLIYGQIPMTRGNYVRLRRITW